MPKRRSPTLAEALEDWLTVRSAGRGLSANTQRAYRADVERLAGALARPAADGDERKAAERVTIDKLTPAALVDALAAIQRSPHAAPATRARIHGTIEQLCAHLVHQGVLAVDPLTIAGIERPKVQKSLPHYIERDEEITRVLVAAGTKDEKGRKPWPERDLALAAVLVGTGVRAGELVAAIEEYLADRLKRTKKRPRRDDPLWRRPGDAGPCLPPIHRDLHPCRGSISCGQSANKAAIKSAIK